MMSRGYWTLGRLGGAPIRLHWTLPLGALVLGRFQFVPAFWIGFALLILIHELGHALLVLRYRLGLSEVVLHGLGGYCRHARGGTRFQEAAVAWGGVLAQALALLLAEVLLLVLGPPRSVHAAQLAYVFTASNLWLMGLNLLPIEPLDGAKAWPLLGMLRERWRGRSGGGRPQRDVQEELRDLEQRHAAERGDETPSQRTERIVRELIDRTTQSRSRRS